ncbi:MAG: FAD-dependent monooxygenase [Burkholderiales bacterium]|nr:FAD-dependent monooxygenase [Burkholderiales bacterium]
MHDIAIIGGGPVGLSAALAAAGNALKAIVLEARPDTGVQDARVFALSYGARLILERLGSWPPQDLVHPIRAVHVSQRGHFGHSVLSAAELRLDALGYVVSYADLVAALREQVARAGVELVAGARVVAFDVADHAATVRYELAGVERTAHAHVVAQADGGASPVAAARTTEHDYGQCAVVAEIDAERALLDRAYERFTGRGPIALLPFRGHHALIWTVPHAGADRLLGLGERPFEQALMEAYGERIGTLALRGPRAAFKLVLRYAHRVAGERHALIGNAAQTLHPVAGQGFNLGLRDAFELAQALAACARRGEDLLAGLRRYRTSRRFDRAGGTLFTDALVRLFSNDDPLLGVGRGIGLLLFDAAGPGKRFLMRRMIFGNPG